MQMTNAELTDFLNARLGLTGQDAVTGNVVRQWVAWKVLPKATAQGRAIGTRPSWSRSGAALHRATRLGELRKQGIRRENALIVQAYIEWGHPDFSRVRDALSSELRKWAAQLTRRQTTFLGKTKFPEMSATQKRAIAAQMGPLDDLFRETRFEQSREFYAAIGEFSRTGEGDSDYLTNLVAEALHKILPRFHEEFSESVAPIFVNSFSGLIGSPDEIGNSAETTIKTTSERQFRIARHQIRLFLGELRKSDLHRQRAARHFDAGQLWQVLDSLAPQISTGPWLLFSFAQVLKCTFPRSKIDKRPLISGVL